MPWQGKRRILLHQRHHGIEPDFRIVQAKHLHQAVHNYLSVQPAANRDATQTRGSKKLVINSLQCRPERLVEWI